MSGAAALELNDRAGVARVLHDVVVRVCGDVVYRRELRYQPATALRRTGLESLRLPEQLPVRHHEVQVDFAADVLFGPLGSPCDTGAEPLEVTLVRAGLKPAALVHGSGQDAVGLVESARTHGLAAVLSPFAFDPVLDANGYINIAGAARPATSSTDGWRGVVVARDWNAAILAWLSLLFRWDELLGYVLGYPSCCVARFADRWRMACERFGGEVAMVLLDEREQRVVQPRHPCMNLFARYFGYALTEHFPCSFECEATMALGARLAVGLDRVDPGRAALIDRGLRSTVLVHPTDGVVLFEGAQSSDDGTFTFDEARATQPDSPLARAMSSARRASTADPGRWLVFDGSAA